jgi:hypothetical protein
MSDETRKVADVAAAEGVTSLAVLPLVISLTNSYVLFLLLLFPLMIYTYVIRVYVLGFTCFCVTCLTYIC